MATQVGKSRRSHPPSPRAEHGGTKGGTDATRYVPRKKTLPALSGAVQRCRGCDLYLHATQAVFGEGPVGAWLVVVGEQPGDFEDKQGRPFVGPSGRLLDRALEAAGIDRSEVYVTNAVKHFNFEPRGKARLHKKPKPGDVRACRPWLEAELEVVQPEAVVLLGAVAAQAVFGPEFRVTRSRGEVRGSLYAPATVATWHPSNILRARDRDARQRLYGELVADLCRARQAARERSP